jgi:hypothetical protein
VQRGGERQGVEEEVEGLVLFQVQISNNILVFKYSHSFMMLWAKRMQTCAMIVLVTGTTIQYRTLLL